MKFYSNHGSKRRVLDYAIGSCHQKQLDSSNMWCLLLNCGKCTFINGFQKKIEWNMKHRMHTIRPFHSTYFPKSNSSAFTQGHVNVNEIFYTPSIYTFGHDKYKFQKINGLSVNYILHLHCFYMANTCVFTFTHSTWIGIVIMHIIQCSSNGHIKWYDSLWFTC
jgi:hypothetical protein